VLCVQLMRASYVISLQVLYSKRHGLCRTPMTVHWKLRQEEGGAAEAAQDKL